MSKTLGITAFIFLMGFFAFIIIGAVTNISWIGMFAIPCFFLGIGLTIAAYSYAGKKERIEMDKRKDEWAEIIKLKCYIGSIMAIIGAIGVQFSSHPQKMTITIMLTLCAIALILLAKYVFKNKKL